MTSRLGSLSNRPAQGDVGFCGITRLPRLVIWAGDVFNSTVGSVSEGVATPVPSAVLSASELILGLQLLILALQLLILHVFSSPAVLQLLEMSVCSASAVPQWDSIAAERPSSLSSSSFCACRSKILRFAVCSTNACLSNRGRQNLACWYLSVRSFMRCPQTPQSTTDCSTTLQGGKRLGWCVGWSSIIRALLFQQKTFACSPPKRAAMA